MQDISWDHVASVGVVVELKDSSDSPSDQGWVERWLCQRVIRHIPGGRHAAE
jgi:hypothetical protein